MNRITLALNAAILVVTFVVALTASDVHGSLLASATRTAGQGRRSAGVGTETSVALLRVLQSMDSYYPATPANPLSREQFEGIRDAIQVYYAEVRVGVDDLISNAHAGNDVRLAAGRLGQSVRVDLESILSRSFRDQSVVNRLTTEIARACQ